MKTTLKIGKYQIPALRLHPLLEEAVGRIYEQFSTQEIENINQLAKCLGHSSANSGSFLRKMSCLRAYGLLEHRGLKITTTGIKLVAGRDDREKDEALKQTLLNIPLWRELYHRWGREIPRQDFERQLAQIAGLGEEETKTIAGLVWDAYFEDTQYLKDAKGDVDMRPPPPSSPRPDLGGFRQILTEELSKLNPPAGLEELRLGEVRLYLRPTLDDIEAARGLLNLLEQRLKAKRSKNGNNPPVRVKDVNELGFTR